MPFPLKYPFLPLNDQKRNISGQKESEVCIATTSDPFCFCYSVLVSLSLSEFFVFFYCHNHTLINYIFCHNKHPFILTNLPISVSPAYYCWEPRIYYHPRLPNPTTASLWSLGYVSYDI